MRNIILFVLLVITNMNVNAQDQHAKIRAERLVQDSTKEANAATLIRDFINNAHGSSKKMDGSVLVKPIKKGGHGSVISANPNAWVEHYVVQFDSSRMDLYFSNSVGYCTNSTRIHWTPSTSTDLGETELRAKTAMKQPDGSYLQATYYFRGHYGFKPETLRQLLRSFKKS